MASYGTALKARLVRDERMPWKCATCGISEWRGVQAPLQLDHVDGDRNNCMRSNLRLLCPNCHALTDTFMGRNSSRSCVRIPDEMIVAAYDAVAANGSIPTAGMVYRQLGYPSRPRSEAHRDRLTRALGHDRPIRRHSAPNTGVFRIAWPKDDVLVQLLEKRSRLEVAQMLGVSDTAVKKHCARRGITEPAKRRARRPTATPEDTRVAAAKRLAITQRARKLDRLSKLHGTRAGYQLERRLGITTCTACRKANAECTAACKSQKALLD